jgi:hypothetical protein
LNVPQEPHQEVTLRRLPDGDCHAASLNSLDNQLLRVHLLRVPPGVDVNAGDLVEVNCQKTMYLGEVRSRQGEAVTISVEHALDHETLALIQQVWHGPAGQ